MNGFRRAPVREIVGPGHLHWGVADGVLTIAADHGSLSIPWPMPAPKHGYGHWEPVVMERFPDGTSTALWRWDDDGGGAVAVPWRRADRHPILNVPPWTRCLPPPREPREPWRAHLDEVEAGRDW